MHLCTQGAMKLVRQQLSPARSLARSLDQPLQAQPRADLYLHSVLFQPHPVVGAETHPGQLCSTLEPVPALDLLSTPSAFVYLQSRHCPPQSLILHQSMAKLGHSTRGTVNIGCLWQAVSRQGVRWCFAVSFLECTRKVKWGAPHRCARPADTNHNSSRPTAGGLGPRDTRVPLLPLRSHRAVPII